MCRIFLSLTCLASAFCGYAQPFGSISLHVSDTQQASVPNATVQLLRSQDSALVKTELSDLQGNAWFEKVPYGSYFITISHAGLASYSTRAFVLDKAALQLTGVTLETAGVLQDVVVTAKKPFIQKLNDRIVVNVENSIIAAGSSAMDVLERSPGVAVDQNDALSLRGRAGVIVMIDGKATPMAGADLVNYLKALPSEAVQRVEIITNPSARFDAAGSSGIIDIRLKKDQRLGANGTFTAGFGQGHYAKANSGTTFNYRNKAINLFGNYNFTHRTSFNHLIINRNFFRDAIFQGSDDKDNYAVIPVNAHNARLGADFFPSSKTIVGFVVNSSFVGVKRTGNTTTRVYDRYKIPEFRFETASTSHDHFDNTVANINLKHQFDSLGTELTADMDYGTFTSTSLTRTASAFYNVNGTKRKEDEILDGDQTGRLTLKTGKVDFTNRFNGGSRLETGAKISYVSSDNNARFYNVLTSGSVIDETKTNQFFYQEHNYAAYVNVSKNFKRVDLQLGLRGEQTFLKTRQVKDNKRFKSNYFQLFPSAFFNYKLKDDHTLGASVSRRIDRPGYALLNPFLFQIDATIYATGNPHLKPQTTWLYELSYTLKSINLTLGYSHTVDPQDVVLSKILDVIPDFEIKEGSDSNITVQIPVNLQSTDYAGFTATVPLRIGGWCNIINNVNIYYNRFSGNLGGVGLNEGNLAAQIKTSSNFTFGNGWSAELNATVNTGGRDGYATSKPQWSLAAGAQKTLWKGRGSLRLNVTDLFWTNLPKSTVEYKGSYVENWHAYRDTRVATLTFNYRFGNNNVQAARRRTTASEEERQRAGN